MANDEDVDFCAKGRVLIIGAGTSGLAAADALRQHGCQVTVLEARDRIGGRSYSEPDGEFAGFDIGGHWVMGADKHQPVLRRMRELGVEAVIPNITGHFANLYDADGHVLARSEVERLTELGRQWKQALDAIFAKLNKRREFLDGWSDPDAATAYSEALETLERHLKRNLTGVERRFIENSWADVETDGAALLAQQGLKSLMEPDVDCLNDGGESCRSPSTFVRGGYGAWVRALASRLPLDIHLSSPVAQVGRDAAGGVSVLLENGTSLSAAAAIVTVPLGVLKANAIKFDPPLSLRRRLAIEALGFGTVDWVHVRFDKPFWPTDVYEFRYLSQTRGDYKATYNHLVEETPFHGAPVLSTLLFSSREAPWPKGNDSLENLTDAELELHVMKRLRLMFGDEVPKEPAAFRVSRWGQDPYIRGSYSVNPPGVDARSNYFLGGAESSFGGALHFAGEATCGLMYASVHGAYVSGLREACALLGPRCGESVWPWFDIAVRGLCETAPVPPDGHGVPTGSEGIGRANGQGMLMTTLLI
eukprot:TRINITY_DN33660_c0_g1_i1.p1 TRINITY_DN33660_c0_g1~~TRINITY_DN33660_c0_g1_i1.p1  ORF type:complete len:563 (+),score=61.58 TRINITY_DN33660_c0_g1_i1:91-1689(+)